VGDLENSVRGEAGEEKTGDSSVKRRGIGVESMVDADQTVMEERATGRVCEKSEGE